MHSPTTYNHYTRYVGYTGRMNTKGDTEKFFHVTGLTTQSSCLQLKAARLSSHVRFTASLWSRTDHRVSVVLPSALRPQALTTCIILFVACL